MKLNNSLIFKTTSAIVLALLLILSTLGFYVSNSQKSIINEIMSDHREYITLTRNKLSQNALNEEVKNLNRLIIIIRGTFANALINANDKSIKITMTNLLNKNNIKVVSIYDKALEQLFAISYKKGNEVIFDTKLPLEFIKLNYIEKTLIVENENVGYLRIYYDNIPLALKIEEAKIEDMKNFNKKVINIESKIQAKKYNQLSGLIIGVSLMIILVYLLLSTLVNKPLILVKKSLDKFFDFLQNKTETIEKIQLDSKDEFGVIAKSINENIIVSVKLHKEIKELNTNLEDKVKDRTLELKSKNLKIQKSINFASIIQQTFNHKAVEVEYFFKDYFIILQQKDTVGGDMIIFEKLNDHECLFFIIDCTSHGVPGAFVSMIVKTLQKQIVKDILQSRVQISTSSILSSFNHELKHLLLQTEKSSISNVGFDGHVVYFNKNTNTLMFSSARNDMVIAKKDELTRIRGDKHSVGYKGSDLNYKFKEYVFEIKESINMYFYSDGYTDQLGEKENIPFGHKNTLDILKECQHQNTNMEYQKKYLMTKLKEHQLNKEQNDDISFVGLHIKGEE